MATQSAPWGPGPLQQAAPSRWLPWLWGVAWPSHKAHLGYQASLALLPSLHPLPPSWLSSLSRKINKLRRFKSPPPLSHVLLHLQAGKRGESNQTHQGLLYPSLSLCCLVDARLLGNPFLSTHLGWDPWIQRYRGLCALGAVGMES